jgi:hypothetical protein
MKHIKGKDPFVFVRFGGLNLKKQKGYTSDTSQKLYHSPPAPCGIYAMPKICQEFFLISSIEEFQPHVFPKKFTDRKKHLRLIRKEFRKDQGYVWHHLGDYCKQNEIVDRDGSWVKTDMKTWTCAFSKMSVILREKNYSGIVGYFSKDHCEVFFDEKI